MKIPTRWAQLWLRNRHGEPKSDDPDILEKRMKGVHSIEYSFFDTKESREYGGLKTVWWMLGKPLSEVSERLLHNEFASRGSARDKLSRLLSAIDHRDGESAANLCSNDCIWSSIRQGRYQTSDWRTSYSTFTQMLRGMASSSFGIARRGHWCYHSRWKQSSL